MLEIVSSVLQTDIECMYVDTTAFTGISINGLTNKPCVSILSIFNYNQAKLSIWAYIPN